MIFTWTQDDDGSTGLRLDEEGIEYLEQGLRQLRLKDPGERVVAPAVWTSDEGEPVVGESFLELAS